MIRDGEFVTVKGTRYRLTPCKSCGALMLWCETEKGKAMPVDPDSVNDGNLTIVALGTRGPVVHYLTRDEMAEIPDRFPKFEAGGDASHVKDGRDLRLRYKSHFATCPKASQHRSR